METADERGQRANEQKRDRAIIRQCENYKMKKKLWSTKNADNKFSLWIRARDGKCLRCNRTEMLQNSHFWARANSATRYSPENCITLCYPCHYGNKSYGWEYAKQGEYRNFMLNMLGEDEYENLYRLSQSTMKRSDAILGCMKLLGY